MPMRIRVLDLDGSILAQRRFISRYSPSVVSARSWGPRIRIACSFRRFRDFERSVLAPLAEDREEEPTVNFCGSGDFHHVTLGWLRRRRSPCNLLVLDNHPDWMTAIPFLHCGTWLRHVVRLPQVRRVIHVGGNADFENGWRWLAPWRELRTGRITVFPALCRFQRGGWRNVTTEALREDPERPASAERVTRLFTALGEELRRDPLYVTVDKDVLLDGVAPANWDCGKLGAEEVIGVVCAALAAAGGRLAGMDVVGDWSAVDVRGWLRGALHQSEHPLLHVDAAASARRNEIINLALVEALGAAAEKIAASSPRPGGSEPAP